MSICFIAMCVVDRLFLRNKMHGLVALSAYKFALLVKEHVMSANVLLETGEGDQMQ